MKLIGTHNYNKKNRSEKTESIVDALNRSGETRVEYFKARLWGVKLSRGKGHPTPVGENDEWNMVKITYQEKDALEIFYSGFGCSGRFYHENFDDAENQKIVDALARADFPVLENYMKTRRWMRLAGVGFIFGALLVIIDGWMYGDQEIVHKFAFLILLFLMIIWFSYWDRIWL
jgi:hypothetical protein